MEEQPEIECSTSFQNPESKRVRKEILTARLSSALDKCKDGDRDVVHIWTACVEALNLNPREYIINRSSIKRKRETFRKQAALGIK